MSSSEAPILNRKPSVWQRIAERYRWMSLRNKIGLWSLMVVLLVGGVSVKWLQPAYRTTKMWYFLKMADKAIERKDFNSASLAFRKALLSGQENPAVWQALARFLEQVGSPEIINVWERLSTMQPGIAQYRYNQVAAALKFGRVYQAEEVLVRLPQEWRDAPDGLRLAAKIEIQKKQYAAAENLLTRLLKQQPHDKEAEFQLLLLRVNSADPVVRDNARAELEALAATSSEYGLEALRKSILLAKDAGDLNEADRLATKLVTKQAATLQDRLLHAQLEALTNSFTLSITLSNLRTYATTHPLEFAAIMEWLLNTKLDPDGTAAWVANLPPDVKSKPEIQPALFQYYLAAGDWDRVFAVLRNPASPMNLPADVLDLATKALEQDRAEAGSADQVWQQAVYAAEGNPRTLRILSLLASARGWSSATGRALSALATAVPGDASVWWLLVQHENSVRNLPGLYKALEGLMQINPYDINVASNWVLAAALMKQVDKEELFDVAKRTYQSTDPSDPRAATAYAVALLQNKQEKEAIRIIDKMSYVDRRQPQRAIYVGAVLAANGRNAEALEYFERSDGLTDQPFQEEKTLRRIWKGVAMGEATTAEEAEQMLIKRNDPDVQPSKINAELESELRRRSDPAEVRRIFQTLQTEAADRKRPSPEVEAMMRSLRNEQKK